MTESKDVLFGGLKIDGRRAKRQHDPDTGLVSSFEGFLSGSSEGPPDQVALDFLKANYRLLAGRRRVVDELEPEPVKQSPGGYHVTLQQKHGGVPVQDATVTVHMTHDRRVHGAHSRLKPNVIELDVQAMREDGIDEQEAIDIARAEVGSAHDDPEDPSGAKPELVVHTKKGLRLAWKVPISTANDDWYIFIGALTGTVLERRLRS